MEKKGCNPHVLVIPNSAQGHITPMLQFAKRLVPKGIKVTLVTTVYISKSMHVDPESSIAMETISDGFDETGHQAAGSISACFSSFKAHGSRTLAKLIEKFDDLGQPVTGIVYDGLLPWVLDVTKQFGLWKAAFFNQSCAVISIWHHAYRGMIPLPITDPHIVVPELPLLKRLETPFFVQGYPTPPDLYDLFNNQFTNIHEADWVLFATFHKLEEKVLDRMAKIWKVRAVGPTLPSMYLDKRLEGDKDYGIKLFEPKTSTCMSWLKEKPKGSVVYVALGSVADPTSEQIEELAWGLKASNRYFLWVVRESVQSKLPNKFVEETSEQGLVVNWCPQLEVLAHESIGCFVTHCGLNSVLEALSLGVPMVGMPQFVDHLTTGKYVEDVWKVGIRALPDEKGLVGREVLHKSITEIMEGEKGKEAKINVKKWMELAKEAIAEGGSSDKSINEVAASLLCS